MIESGAGPRGGVVAQRAGSGEGRRDMVGIGRALVIPLVAGIAGSRRSRKLAVDMAAGARHGGMRSRQGEAGGVVIEAGRNPGGGAMAHLALLGKAGSRVVGIVGVLEILQMAGNAGSAEISELSTHVAGLALQRGMGAGQGEAGEGVVELGIRPGSRAVADGAVGGEAGGGMIGTGCFLEISHMARRAGGRHRRVAAVHVALSAGYLHVRSGQRPARHRMIEVHVHPRAGVVAGSAAGGKSRRDVVGIAGCGPVLGMATQAIHRRAFKPSAGVTSIAIEGGVHAGQREPGKAQVIELGPEPGIHAVAFLAGVGKSGGGVVGVGGLPKLGRVATEAIGGKPLKLTDGSVFMATVALQ